MSHIAPIPEQKQSKAQESSPNTDMVMNKNIPLLALILAIIFPIAGLIFSLVIKKHFPRGVEGYQLVKAATILSIVLSIVMILLPLTLIILSFSFYY